MVSVVQTLHQQVQGQVVTPKGSQVGSAMGGQSRQIWVQTGTTANQTTYVQQLVLSQQQNQFLQQQLQQRW